MAATYSISDLVGDLKKICAACHSDHDIIARVRPLAQRAAASRELWLDKRFYEADPDQGFGVYLLHEEPDHTLAVFAVSWLPNRGTPPHDHGTWAVVAGVDGPEKNEFFERVDDRSRPGYAELRKIGEKVFSDGEVVALPAGAIHSVWNETDAVTVSLHIYGKHVNHTARSQFDAEKRTETPFILKVD
ncbi:MAG: cysteine dioxygenase family protein [Betaproteobacteria bacterium]|nr:cysteine dioxygenase family protein [Betaproteobacteria bacterium]